MYTIDFTKPIHIHFIGIGGISMSGLAEILLNEGFTVSGSDSKESTLTDLLTKRCGRFCYGQRAANIMDGIDLVVYTAAIHPDNPEYSRCNGKEYPDDDQCRSAGPAHDQLQDLDRHLRNPRKDHHNFHRFPYLGGGYDPPIRRRYPASDRRKHACGRPATFIAEACAYTNSFLSFFPTISIILNIDADHLDFFKDIDDIRHSFRLFAEKLPAKRYSHHQQRHPFV